MSAVEALGLCLDYETELPTLRSILARSKRTQWVVEDVAWDGEMADDDYIRVLGWQGVFRSEYGRALSKKKQRELARQLVAFNLSQVLHGEQGAMMLAGQLINTVDDLDARMFAAIQVRDEARHVEAVRRLVERIGPIYPCGPILSETINTLLVSDLWPKQVLGLQLFLEARALLSFRQHLLFVDDSVFRDAILRIERDEGQHVAFGIRYMDRGISAMTDEQTQEIAQYANWLDRHIWKMTGSDEYRHPFEECNLDFDEFLKTFGAAGRFKLHMKSGERRTINTMHAQFERWFHRALERTGLLQHVENKNLDAMARSIELPEEAEDREVLPWVG